MNDIEHKTTSSSNILLFFCKKSTKREGYENFAVQKSGENIDEKVSLF